MSASSKTASNQFAPDSVDHLLKHELKDTCTDVDVHDFTEAMWMKQLNRIDYESAEWKNFTKRVRDDEIMKENLQDYNASRKKVDLYVPFISLLTRITDLFHEDQAFQKRRKPLFHALRNTVIGFASDYDESDDFTPSQRKPNGVGLLDIGNAGETTS
ncbi:hypothetical protein FRC03_008362 [Tulasnella sp. 419]|nr:hypothetical protein FRC03_008362 [Tulasnella sp. 419]